MEFQLLTNQLFLFDGFTHFDRLLINIADISSFPVILSWETAMRF